LFTSRLKKIIIYAIGIGIVGCFSGLFLSYYLNVPSGAAIIFVQVIVFLLCKMGLFLYETGRIKKHPGR
jgi:zinc transport system permease protein